MGNVRTFAMLDGDNRPSSFYRTDIYQDVVTYKPNPNAGDDGEPAEVEDTRELNQAIPVDAIEITEAQWLDALNNPGNRIWDAVKEDFVPVPLPPLSERMPGLRQAAFDTAMAFGNRITDQVERKWSNIERASFTAQEIEAKAIIAGETMAADAMLPTLAAHKNISAAEYAQQVLDNAATYRQLAIAAVILRRGADDLLSDTIDTPEKLSEAMDQLRQQAAQFVAQFGLKME